jgi:hypothetical protein
MYGLGVEALMEKPLGRNDLIRALEDSLREPGELWLTPATAPMEQSVDITLESVEEAASTCQFQMGRGGCCFTSNLPLTRGMTIGLSIQFARDGRSVMAQGVVRWFDSASSQAGVSFFYLDPSCRSWVIDTIREQARRSFVPQCRCEGSDEPAAIGTGSVLPELNLVH